MIENLGKVSKWDYRFFHLYEDGKRIKEVDVKDVRTKKKYRTVCVILAVGKTNVAFSQADSAIYISLRQLQEVLEATKKIER